MFNILIGEISSNKAIVIAKFLKKNYNDISIISYDNLKYTTNIHTKYVDKHIFIEKKDTHSYITKISKIVSLYNIDLFLPVHSDSIGEIIKRKNEFNESLYYIGNYEDYKKLHIKKELQQIAESLEVNIPKAYSDIATAKIPFVGKPINKSSAKGVIYFNEEKVVCKYKKYNFVDYIFQDYIQGTGCGYSVYCKNGEIKIGYAHKRILEYPYSGGSSIYREKCEEKMMKEVAEKILDYTKWTGFAMFEFKQTKENKFVLIEVNPRIWGSINQGLVNGYDYFSTLIPGKIKKQNTYIKQNIRTYISPHIYVSLLQSIIHLDFRKIYSFGKQLANNRADVSFWNDYKGYMSVIFRLLLRRKDEKKGFNCRRSR